MLTKRYLFSLLVAGCIAFLPSLVFAATSVGNDVSVGGTLGVTGVTTLTGNTFVTGTLQSTGAITAYGAVTLGDATDDDITITGYLASNIIPKTNNAYDLGAYAKAYNDVFASGTVYADTFYGGVLTATSTVTFNGAVTLGDGGDAVVVNSNTWDISAAGSATGLSVVTTTLDGVVIGGSTRAAGSFTTLNANALATITGVSTTGGIYPTTNNSYDLGGYGKAWRNLYVSTTAFLQDADINGVAYGWPSSQGTASTYLKNDGSGALSWASAGGVDNWGRFGSAYGASALMTSTTYPVWFDGAVYTSSTVRLGSVDTNIPTALFTTADGNVRIATTTDMDSNYSLIIGKDTMGSLGAILADGHILPVEDNNMTYGNLGSTSKRWYSGYFGTALYLGTTEGATAQSATYERTYITLSDAMVGTSTYANTYVKIGRKAGSFGMLDNGTIYFYAGDAGTSDPFIRVSNYSHSVTSTFDGGSLKIGQSITDSMMETYNVGKFYVDATTGNVSTSGTLQLLSTATTTLKVDSSSGNKGACLKYQDIDGGGYTYCWFLNGIEECNQTSCE